MNAAQVRMLCNYVDAEVRRDGCDHSHRFARQWAQRESVDWDDLLDLLEANGAFCDCEVVMNLGRGPLQTPAAPAPVESNPWLIPPDFECVGSPVFTKIIVCCAETGRNTYAAEGELLVPAPKGAKPRRRVRKFVNFFIGCRSGLPCEVGFVAECPDITAHDYARRAAGSGFDELQQFTFCEAAFVLSRVARLSPLTPVGTSFADRVGIASKHEELAVHRVFLRK